MQKTITKEINSRLLENFRAEEISKAVMEMGGTKAPGFDGFQAVFFQKFWAIVSEDVTKFCIGVLNRKDSLNEVNSTIIILISKVSAPDCMTSFRPISLCMVLYKIIAKVIANRFKRVLEVCIDDAQGAFVPGRLITE